VHGGTVLQGELAEYVKRWKRFRQKKKIKQNKNTQTNKQTL
jgi:hypothetical protein